MCTAATGSSTLASITSVAPNWEAISSLEATRSMATIRGAPASRAPWRRFRPTPPQPMIATLLPGRTSAVRTTAPTPVRTLHPIRAATSNGTSSGIFATAFLVHEHLLGKRTDVEQLPATGVAGTDPPARSVVGPVDSDPVAQVGSAGQAIPTSAAEDRQAGDDVITRLNGGDRRPDTLDDPGRLVTRDERNGHLPVSGEHVQVAVTQPGGNGSYDDLERLGLVQRDVLDRQPTG